MLDRQYRCGGFEVSVIVHNGESVDGGKSRSQQVRHADGSMLVRCRQGSLSAQRGLPIFVIGWQILVAGAAVRPELLVFGRPARTVERFGIQRCCGGPHRLRSAAASAERRLFSRFAARSRILHVDGHNERVISALAILGHPRVSARFDTSSRFGQTAGWSSHPWVGA
jgi:hypothetical protein